MAVFAATQGRCRDKGDVLGGVGVFTRLLVGVGVAGELIASGGKDQLVRIWSTTASGAALVTQVG